MRLLSNSEKSKLCYGMKLIQFNDQDKIIVKDDVDATV